MPDRSSEFEIGALSGRMDAMEERMGRHENYMGEQLRLLAIRVEKNGSMIARALGAVTLMGWISGIGGLAAIWNAATHIITGAH